MSDNLPSNKAALGIFVTIICIIGSITILWVSLSNQIKSIQISDQLINSQIQRDLTSIETHVLDIQTRRDQQWAQNDKDLSNIHEKLTQLETMLQIHNEADDEQFSKVKAKIKKAKNQ